MSTELTRSDYSLSEYDAMSKYAAAMFCSGLFADVKNEAQALVKVMAGRELGLGPFVAMRDLAIIQGKIAIASAQIAAKIQAAGGSWEAIKYEDDGCVLRFFRDGRALKPDIEFNMRHAEQLGLAGKDNYRKQPRTMLFWRAMTMGARMHFPGAFNGAAYTPEELAAGGDGDLIAPIVAAPAAPPAPVVEPTKAQHHLSVVSDRQAEKQAAITAALNPPHDPWEWRLQGTPKLSPYYRNRKLREVKEELLKTALTDAPEKFSMADKEHIIAALDRRDLREPKPIPPAPVLDEEPDDWSDNDTEA